MINQDQLTNCDKEPIHIPGSIQPIGFMLLVDKSSYEVQMEVGKTPSDFLNKNLFEEWPEIQNIFGNLERESENDITVNYRSSTYSLRIHLFDQNDIIIEAMKYQGEWRKEDKLLTQFYSIFDQSDNAISIYKEVCDFVKDLTGFDRVMLYKFGPDNHGNVIAESKEEGLYSYLYHQFPASDIPVQARALYVKNRVRFIANVDHQTISIPQQYSALDMSNCTLRAVSSIHIEYLKNMGVQSSMSISIVLNGQLWGLIACHHMQEKIIAFENMKLLQLVSYTCSREFLRIENEMFYRKRDSMSNKIHSLFKNINLANEENPTKAILKQLANIFNCHNIIYTDKEKTVSIHKVSKELIQDLNDLVSDNEIFHTNDFALYPHISEKYSAIFSGAMGLKLDPYNESFIWFLRTEITKTVKWAGNPAKDMTDGIVSPRQSFESWEEIQKNKSIIWDKAELFVAEHFFKLEFLKIIQSEKNSDPIKLVDSSKISMIITDPNIQDNPIIHINESFKKLYGYNDDDVIGKNPRLLHGNSISKSDSKKYKRAINNKEALSILVQNQMKNGEKIWVMNNITPIFDNFGKLQYFVGSQHNVSEFEIFQNKEGSLANKTYIQRLLNTQENLLLVSNGIDISYVNMSFLNFFGYASLDQFTQNHHCICELFIKDDPYFHFEYYGNHSSWIKEILKLPQEKRTICMISSKFESHIFTVHINIFDKDSYVVTLSDISANMQKQLELFKSAMYDQLTSTYNRHFFDKNITKLIEDVSVKSKTLGVIITDIDHFKKVNDLYGHDIGDETLKVFSTTLENYLREDDWIIRWGGEEFIIITVISSPQDITLIADHLCQRISQTSINSVGKVTASFGATTFLHNEDIQDTIKRADQLLYKAKTNGRNRVESN